MIHQDAFEVREIFLFSCTYEIISCKKTDIFFYKKEMGAVFLYAVQL